MQREQGQVEPEHNKVGISSGFDRYSFAKPEVAVGWPPSNLLTAQMLEFNRQGRWIPAGQGPVNVSSLPPDAIPIVLYVHNRPSYLRVVLDALSHVRGIEETVLIVSHDGYYPEVAEIVGEITFTRVKQVRVAGVIQWLAFDCGCPLASEPVPEFTEVVFLELPRRRVSALWVAARSWLCSYTVLNRPALEDKEATRGTSTTRIECTQEASRYLEGTHSRSSLLNKVFVNSIIEASPLWPLFSVHQEVK